MSNHITLKEYIQSLNELMEANPDAGDLPVYYHEDDEGNGLNRVSFMPAVYRIVDNSDETRTVEGEDVLDYDRDGYYKVCDYSGARTVTGVDMLNYARDGYSIIKCVIIN